MARSQAGQVPWGGSGFGESSGGSARRGLAVHLTLVLHLVVLSLRPRDASCGAQSPMFLATDVDRPAGAAGSGVGAGPDPPEDHGLVLVALEVEGDGHAGKRVRERGALRGDRRAARSRRVVVAD